MELEEELLTKTDLTLAQLIMTLFDRNYKPFNWVANYV